MLKPVSKIAKHVLSLPFRLMRCFQTEKEVNSMKIAEEKAEISVRLHENITALIFKQKF